MAVSYLEITFKWTCITLKAIKMTLKWTSWCSVALLILENQLKTKISDIKYP